MPRTPRLSSTYVGVIADPLRASHISVLLGIADHVAQSDRWAIECIAPQQCSIESRELDGLIVASDIAATHGALSLAIPLVSVGQTEHPRTQSVRLDVVGLAGFLVDRLLPCRCASYAIFGTGGTHVTDLAGAIADAFAAASITPLSLQSAASQDSGALARELIAAYKPLGVIACSIACAHQLREACAVAQLSVPGEVAILSAENQPALAGMLPPRITCVEDYWRLMGHEAARQLQRLMDGATIGPPVMLAPAGIDPGETLPGRCVSDELVAGALQYIQANLQREIRTDDLLTALVCSRRSLERRFREALGHGPATEIRAARLSLVQRLLCQTDLPLKAVARKCGFTSPKQMQRLLRAGTSLTPGQYRKRHRSELLATAS